MQEPLTQHQLFRAMQNSKKLAIGDFRMKRDQHEAEGGRYEYTVYGTGQTYDCKSLTDALVTLATLAGTIEEE